MTTLPVPPNVQLHRGMLFTENSTKHIWELAGAASTQYLRLVKIVAEEEVERNMPIETLRANFKPLTY